MRASLGTAIVSAVVSAAVCLGLHWAGILPAGSNDRKPAEVPQLRELTQAQARQLLVERGLLLVVDGEVVDAMAAGLIAEQRPLAGSQLLKGSAVYVRLAMVAPTPAAVAAPPPASAPVAVSPTAAPVAAP